MNVPQQNEHVSELGQCTQTLIKLRRFWYKQKLEGVILQGRWIIFACVT